MTVQKYQPGALAKPHGLGARAIRPAGNASTPLCLPKHPDGTPANACETS
jgi:hypothetical protein